VQVYVSDVEASVPVPHYTLVGFEKVYLRPGETKNLHFEITPDQLACFTDDGTPFVESGEFKVYVGAHAPVANGAVAELTPLMSVSFQVVEQLVEQKMLFSGEEQGLVDLPYLLYQPENTLSNPGETYPLLVFLHGMGERGSDLCSIRVHGLPKVIEKGGSFPFYVASPQCPQSTVWGAITPAIHALIEDICQNYPVDTDGIWITGLSMGGFGTWQMLVDYPDTFAAAAPICGGLMDAHYQPSILKKIVNIPIWNFHGDADPVVNVEHSDYLVEKLRELGGKIRYTRYPGVDHDSWTETYDNPVLYQWLMSKKRTQ
jgi:predicted peptidase